MIKTGKIEKYIRDILEERPLYFVLVDPDKPEFIEYCKETPSLYSSTPSQGDGCDCVAYFISNWIVHAPDTSNPTVVSVRGIGTTSPIHK